MTGGSAALHTAARWQFHRLEMTRRGWIGWYEQNPARLICACLIILLNVAS